jgi:heme/copper-type cytochrome/quinol oxidase subunit 2
LAAAVLTLVLAFIAGGSAWLLLGPRLPLAEAAEQNQVLNLVAYVAVVLPFAFVLVFFLLENL